MQHYLIDENLSRKLISLLLPVSENISHVAEEGLLQSFDGEIWKFAKARSSIIITKDIDFADMSHLYGCPPKVIKLSCGNRTTAFIGGLLSVNAELIQTFAQSDKCYLEIF
jgi:predicted nuclease of predicted toxin-antitoxin system